MIAFYCCCSSSSYFGRSTCGFKLVIILSTLIICAKIDDTSAGDEKLGDDIWRSDLDKYLQPIDIGRDTSYDEFKDDGIICIRDCTAAPEQRICYYKIVVEQYTAMGPACDNCPTDWNACFNKQCVQADGIERMVLTMNRQIPGPSINVCHNDRIVVDVLNKMPSRSLTLHWHGQLQRKSPWMDGVPHLTQCPIEEGQKFRYNFLASTLGTHFYHAHTSHQILDGLLAPLIVRTHKDLDPHSHEYDFDLPSHTIIFNDWTHFPSDVKYPGYNKNLTHVTFKADNYLINGKGSYADTVAKIDTGTPHAVFHVKSGGRYRFRLIASTSFTCPFKFTIEGHTMKLIAIDGSPCETQDVRSLVFVAGDRFDVIITADQPSRSYWMIVKGQDLCDVQEQTAYLVYDDNEWVPDSSYDIKTIFQPPFLEYVQFGCITNSSNLCTDEVKSFYPPPERLLHSKPYETIFLTAQGYPHTVEELFRSNTYHRFDIPGLGPSVGGGMFSDMFNNISSVLPPFPPLTQSDDIPEDILCPEKCTKPICYCFHVKKVPLNSIIEIVLLDDLSTPALQFHHPQHLHGHHFVVMKQGTPEERKQQSFWTKLNKSPKPMVRDVVTVPGGGFSVVRFEANNPGFWMFHCHFNFHLHGGMFLVFQVGEREQFLKTPAHFPRCGNYLPSL